MTINKKSFRNAFAALTFGAIATVIPAYATTTVSVATSSSPTSVGVGGYDWIFNGSTTTPLTLPTSGGLTFNGNTMSSEFGLYSSVGDTGATNSASEVIDVSVAPTVKVNGATQAASAVVFQGSIQAIGSGANTQYEMLFGSNGTQACANAAVSCTTTSNGNVVNNGQSIVNIGGTNYTELVENGIDYAVQSQTFLTPGKATYFNGYIGLATAPEPATMATTGLAAAFLGLFLRRKAKQNS